MADRTDRTLIPMATVTSPIPYIKQSDSNGKGGRNCGAACLSMAYASFGMKVSPDEIWPAISKRNQFGSLASTTHLMAKDAISRGFDALIIQATYPLQVLRICQERGIRAILNHRLDNTSTAGHYSLLVGLDKSGVTLHDPLAGPSRPLSFEQLMDLWRPVAHPSETLGNVVVGIAQRPPDRAFEACLGCKLPVPETAPCPKCQHPVTLRPMAMLGCIAEQCGSRYWTHVSCPECDCTWSFYGKPEPKGATAASQSAPGPAIDPLDVDQLYAHVDKFVQEVQRNPAAAANEDIQKHVAFIYSQKEVVRLALEEAAAARKQQMDHINALTQMAATNKEALEKRKEEAARQSPPLDGDALGIALLRNLGFSR